MPQSISTGSRGGRTTWASPEEGELSYLDILGSVKDKLLGGLKNFSVMFREGRLQCGDETYFVHRALLDTGAQRGSYIGAAMVAEFVDLPVEPCSHWVRLGDGETQVHITQYVTLDVSLYDDEGKLSAPISTEFYVMPKLGKEIIIGLPDILGNYYDFFSAVLERARTSEPTNRIGRLHQIYALCKEHLCSAFLGGAPPIQASAFLGEVRPKKDASLFRRATAYLGAPQANHGQPDRKFLKACAREARATKSWYEKHKFRVRNDLRHTETIRTDSKGNSFTVLSSVKFGTAYGDDEIERLCEVIISFQDFPVGKILDAWSKPNEECPEEDETPDPLSISESVLRFMETSVEDAEAEYHSLLGKQINEDMLKAVPRVMDIMTSPAALKTFCPRTWNGLQVPPVEFDIVGDLPKTMPARARPIRPDLYAHAKKEFDRLAQYFYESDPRKCTSPIASPLVIAPKATTPFIRFCGDYRQVNDYIAIPQHPIPIVQHELTKAAQFKVYVDLDMTNSFHQIPLGEQASQLLSVQTPWGLVRPKFLPEGVGPASGLLQSIVRGIFNFEDFADWTIVIFDNFLVLADDYEDAANKLERVIARCAEFGVILKIKKSFIGASTVTFFGYEVTHGQWKLSESRKDSIEAFPFPTTKKEMQSFLGAALFFHNHIPDYSQWSAKLYEMTHDGFNWDPGTWTFDYRGHFDKFKTAIRAACTLFFPRYDLPWVIRCDASEYAVGAMLFQIFTRKDGTIEYQPIAFSSKRFSDPATKWDAYKREAYAIYHAVHSFAWYLRGKEFLVETDHRNLQWIEASQSPIVCRWRALLQSFKFRIFHIPGRENRVADWLSRPTRYPAFLGSDPPNKPLAFLGDNTPFQASALLGSSPPIKDYAFLGGDLPNKAASTEPARTLDSMLQEVHGGRELHYGVAHTWRRSDPGGLTSTRCR